MAVMPDGECGALARTWRGMAGVVAEAESRQ